MTKEELEKEYKDLMWQFKEVVKDNDYWQAENRRLEKENADFIKKVFKLVKINNKLKGENAKAKGMIKVFVDYEKANAIILNYNEFLKRAEDFIKESE